MSSLWVCRRCCQRLTSSQWQLRYASSLAGDQKRTDTADSDGPRERRSKSVVNNDGVVENDEGRSSRASRQLGEGQSPAGVDHILETLFATTIERPQVLRYSRAPITQEDRRSHKPPIASRPSPSTQISASLSRYRVIDQTAPVVSASTQEDNRDAHQPGVPEPIDQQCDPLRDAIQNWGPKKLDDVTPQDPLAQPEGPSIAPLDVVDSTAFVRDSESLPKDRFRMPTYKYFRKHEDKESPPDQDWVSSSMLDMSRAVKNSNAEQAVRVWTKAKHYLNSKSLRTDSAKIDDLYTRLLSSFFELRRAETAISVWNFMVEKDHKITKIHWTAMLHACIRVHDVSSLQDIWGNMHKSNIKPDTATWTTYIRGLIKCRQWRKGLEALDQLGRLWKGKSGKRGSNRQVASPPDSTSSDQGLTPDLAPVKATLDALIDIDKLDLLDSVLAWASSHGLHADTHIYNILLRPLARKGDPAAIRDFLANMASHNCQPDITTFTIILSSLVSSPASTFHDLSPPEQDSTIISFLKEMTDASIPPNTRTYSALISALLQPPSPNQKHNPANPRTAYSRANLSAARTVLAHMQTASIPPTPHIYTILLGHYFSQNPPDLDSIQSLWSSIRAFPKQLGGPQQLADPILYDRMIEGLADAGQAEDSLGFVKSMVKEGKVPGWVALGRCLEALHRAGDGGRVRWLVEEVEREGGVLKWGERELRGKGWWERRVAELRAERVLSDRIDRLCSSEAKGGERFGDA